MDHLDLPEPEFLLPETVSPAGEGQVQPRARLPAALRVLLYLLAWLAVVLALHFALETLYVAVLVMRGATLAAALQDLGTWSGSLPSLPLLALLIGGQFLATLGVTLLFTAFVDRRPFRSLGFDRVRRWWAHWGLGFAMEGFHFALLCGIALMAGWYRVVGAASLPRAAVILAAALGIALPAAATEELMMRGYVLQTLEQRYGTVWAVGLSSLVFALLHSWNPGGFRLLPLIGLFAAGVYLSIPYLATRQLWLPIAMHTAWNLFEGPVFGLPVSGLPMPASILRVRTGGPALWTGGAFGPEEGLLVLITSAISAVIVWHAARRLLG